MWVLVWFLASWVEGQGVVYGSLFLKLEDFKSGFEPCGLRLEAMVLSVRKVEKKIGVSDQSNTVHQANLSSSRPTCRRTGVLQLNMFTNVMYATPEGEHGRHSIKKRSIQLL